MTTNNLDYTQSISRARGHRLALTFREGVDFKNERLSNATSPSLSPLLLPPSPSLSLPPSPSPRAPFVLRNRRRLSNSNFASLSSSPSVYSLTHSPRSGGGGGGVGGGGGSSGGGGGGGKGVVGGGTGIRRRASISALSSLLGTLKRRTNANIRHVKKVLRMNASLEAASSSSSGGGGNAARWRRRTPGGNHDENDLLWEDNATRDVGMEEGEDGDEAGRPGLEDDAQYLTVGSWVGGGGGGGGSIDAVRRRSLSPVFSPTATNTTNNTTAAAAAGTSSAATVAPMGSPLSCRSINSFDSVTSTFRRRKAQRARVASQMKSIQILGAEACRAVNASWLARK